MFEIRKTAVEDLESIDHIIDSAVLYMRQNGNLEQWNKEDGVKDKIRQDIVNGGSYVVVLNEEICATFAFYIMDDPTYRIIDGKWKSEKPYGVLHRTASAGKYSGMMDVIIEYCLKKIKHIRIDTHKDNKPMKRALKRNGFDYCGVITLENGQYRDAYERIDMDIKKLGFGMMRLPRTDGKIDIDQTKKMVDLFIENGFNYFDTAWVYEGSEDAVRLSLTERYPRDSYFLASKLAFWSKDVHSKEDAYRELDESLLRCGVDYFDNYLVHCIKDDNVELLEQYDIWNFVKKAKEEGKIRHLGFSFHGTPEMLERILSEHKEVEFVQLQINYADWNNPRVKSKECYETARKHGVPVIIMEPVKGGRLSDPNDKVKEVFDSYNEKRSYASWAIRFCADLEGVLTVLSGMSTTEQVKDNTSFMKDFKQTDRQEKEIIDKARKVHESIPVSGCTGCDYCKKVCPKEIRISSCFSLLDSAMIYGVSDKMKERYKDEMEGQTLPDECLKCGACESVCPQHLPIRELLEKTVKTF